MHKYILIGISLLMISPGANAQCSEVELIRLGLFHNSETDPSQGGQWFGLVETDTGFELQQYELSINQAYDMISDDKKDDTSTYSGWKVTVSDESNPIFLFRNVNGIEIGPVKTYFYGHHLVTPESPVLLGSYDNPLYSLRAEGERTNNRYVGYQLGNYSLYLYMIHDRNFIRTDLVSNRINDHENAIEVIWIGDIDSDGVPDILLDTGNHYNVTEYSLYLSTCAEEGELVKFVAKFRNVGC